MLSASFHKQDWHRWYRLFRLRRPMRVLLLLAAVWIVNGFDLGFTLFARQTTWFTELNPAADWALRQGTAVAVLFKVLLVGTASAILWRCRRLALSEGLLWVFALMCVGLSLRWHNYFEFFADGRNVQLLALPDRPVPDARRTGEPPIARGENRAPDGMAGG